MAELQQIEFYDLEGVYRVLEWDKEGKRIVESEEIALEDLVLVPYGESTNGKDRTQQEIAEQTLVIFRDNCKNEPYLDKITHFYLVDILAQPPAEKIDGRVNIFFAYKRSDTE